MKTDVTHSRLRLVARFVLGIALVALVTLSTAHALEKWIFKPPKELQYGLSPIDLPFVPILFLP